jgi:MFS family permease
MNMWGNIGGAIATTVNGYLLRWFQANWNIAFYVSAAIYLVAVVLWKFLEPATPLLQPDEPNAAPPAP